MVQYMSTRYVSISAILLVALLIMEPCLSSAYHPTVRVNGTSRWRAGGRRVLETSTISNNGIRTEIVHRDSNEGGLTLAERIQQMVDRSSSRANNFARKMAKVSIGSEDAAALADMQSRVSVGDGEYVMSLNIGTPSKAFSVIVDTGSDLTWIQCNPCPNCFQQPSALFDPTQSSSYQALGCANNLCQALPVVESCSPSCEYFYEYGDQSTTVGIFSMETLTMFTAGGAAQQVGNVAFGCGHDNRGSFSGVDGLIGLGQGPVSFTSQLSSQIEGKFSYCLVSLIDSPSQTSPLLFGSAAIPSGNVMYTPIVTNLQHPTYYYVGLEGISVGGVLLDIPQSVFAIDSSGAGGTILDSGTTITQLISPAYKVLVHAFQTTVKYPQVSGSATGLDLCFDISGTGSNSNSPTVVVPTLTFHFDQADVDLPGENYFVSVDDVGTLCLAMAGFNGFTIFGNIQQQNFQIVYDRAGGRVGFKQTQCDSL